MDNQPQRTSKAQRIKKALKVKFSKVSILISIITGIVVCLCSYF